MTVIQKKTIAGVLIVIILVLDFSIANVFKWLTGYPWKSYGQQRVEKLYRVSSDVYHHDLVRNKVVNDVPWGHLRYSVRTNSLGFKDSSVRDVPLTSERHRIIFIGDSFTEGIGVEYKDSFVGLIASALSMKEIEVLNAGVVGYSPIIYWRKIKYLLIERGLEFDELVVFLDISDPTNEVVSYQLNEKGNVVERLPFSQEEKNFKTFLRDNTILLYIISNGIYDMVFPERAKYTTNLEISRWTVDKELYEKYGREGLELMKLYMDKLLNLLKEHDIVLTVAVYPWPDQIINNDLDSIQVLFWKDWCKKRNVRFLDYFPYFLSEGGLKDRKRTLDKYFIKGDWHWNREGHKLIADRFLDFYEIRK